MRSLACMLHAGPSLAALLLLSCPPPAPGRGTLRVTVLEGDEPGIAVQSAVVKLLGQSVAATTNHLGVATLSGLGAGDYMVSVLRLGFCPTRHPATVLPGAVTEITIWMCTDAVLTWSSPASDFTALLDVRSEGDPICKNDTVLSGKSGGGVLHFNALKLDSPTPACQGAAWILSPDHAPEYSNNSPDFPWTDGTGDVYARGLSAPRLRIPVTIWISELPDAERANLRSKLSDLLLPKANGLLQTSYAGLRLSKDESTDLPPEIIEVKSIIDPSTSQPPYDKIGSGCENFESIRATPSIYHSEKINVYYVAMLSGDTPRGYDCYEWGAPNIVFLQSNLEDYWTLLHEIGHALGLQRPDWGHTDALPGFYRDGAGNGLNLMAVYNNTPDYFSAGQVVRMHYSDESWLNWPTGASGTVRSRQVTGGTPLVGSCGCPLSAENKDCPKQRIDIVRAGSTLPEDARAWTCDVKTPPCIALAPSSSTTFDATFYTDATETVAGNFDGKVHSLTPSLVTAASMASSSPPFGTKLTSAASAGTGIVRVYGGGSYAEVAVHVGGTCP